METVPDPTRMRLVGGNLALDFVNTRTGPPVGPATDDVLTGYDELVGWAAYAGALTPSEAVAMTAAARRDADGAVAAFRRALRLRDDLDDIFRALATHQQPTPDALLRLRDDAAEAIGHARLERRESFAWSWQDDRTPARPLWPVVHSALQLLTAGELDRIKRCGGCSFVFIDESKNRSRRWCSMDDCGTAEKVRRYVAARRSRRAT
jgi:predicted RNA-binding Zn ribbon-like protein